LVCEFIQDHEVHTVASHAVIGISAPEFYDAAIAQGDAEFAFIDFLDPSQITQALFEWFPE
jgi:hypothetical protein